MGYQTLMNINHPNLLAEQHYLHYKNGKFRILEIGQQKSHQMVAIT